MKQVLQSLKTGQISLANVPVPSVKSGHLLIATTKSLISLGTERMLLQFGRAGWLDKARQQPDKVKMVMQKIRTDGLIPTCSAVSRKLEQPFTPGYSSAGVVIAVGESVEGYKIGDRVICNGQHAEVVCVPKNLCAKIPDNVVDTTACFTVVSSIALQGVRLAAPSIGENIVVMGLGLIGLITVQILVANGCRVTGIDFDKDKVELARSYGATALCLSDSIDSVRAVTESFGDCCADAVLITASTDSSEPVSHAAAMCRKRGRIILVGVTGLNLSRDDFYKKELTFQVSCSYGPGRYDEAYENKGCDYPVGYVRWTEQRNFRAVLELMSSNKINVERLVSHELDLENAVEAYDIVSADKKALGIVLKYNSEVKIDEKSVHLPGPFEVGISVEPGKPVSGFIGAGNYADSILIPAFAKTGTMLKSIVSSTGVTGSYTGEKFGFSISTTDTNKIFDDPQINSVIIATRHDSHADLVLRALEAGKHVFVEKPLCMSFEQLEQIKKTWELQCKIKPLILMVGFNRRFSPLVKKCKSIIKNTVCSFIVTVNAGQIPADHWTQDLKAGGGRILGEACHFIDLLRYLAGSSIKSVETKYMIEPGYSVPHDTACITIAFANGSVGSINYFANGCKDFPKERIEVFSSGRIIQIDNFKKMRVYPDGSQGLGLWVQDKGQKSCAKAFINAIEKGNRSPVSFKEIFEVSYYSLLAAGISKASDNSK